MIGRTETTSVGTSNDNDTLEGIIEAYEAVYEPGTPLEGFPKNKVGNPGIVIYDSFSVEGGRPTHRSILEKVKKLREEKEKKAAGS